MIETPEHLELVSALSSSPLYISFLPYDQPVMSLVSAPLCVQDLDGFQKLRRHQLQPASDDFDRTGIVPDEYCIRGPDYREPMFSIATDAEDGLSCLTAVAGLDDATEHNMACTRVVVVGGGLYNSPITFMPSLISELLVLGRKIAPGGLTIALISEVAAGFGNEQFVFELLPLKWDAAQAFRYGLAAASASCLIIDHRSHFDTPIMHKIFDSIMYKQFEESL
ncbi:hypothetical protein HK097_006807 [Rhizophlyctis rosea]|uniref:Uncharacterized protein n=1 Tax=Rhizophlyctis rosea TaxID=64517 RepID=A0AAD5SCY3_9FUNG|nr:hypothetical protein HK097_006807 [Rhizophlyctis rosea]